MLQTLGNDRWFALFVRLNYELAISAALRGKGFQELLPTYQSRRRWSDRTKVIETPLFPGYVFCRFNPDRRLPILTIPGVHSIVGIGKVPVPVEEQEIENLKVIAASSVQGEPCPYLKIGQKIRIERGVLEGVEGILVATKKPYRIVVSVMILQRSVALELDESWARPLETKNERPFQGASLASRPYLLS